MGIRTGKAFLASLRDERHIHIDGERVTDVTHDPRFAGAAWSLADLYDMQHDPALAPRMTFASPVDGAPVGAVVHRAALGHGSRAPARDDKIVDGKDVH